MCYWLKFRFNFVLFYWPIYTIDFYVIYGKIVKLSWITLLLVFEGVTHTWDRERRRLGKRLCTDFRLSYAVWETYFIGQNVRVRFFRLDGLRKISNRTHHHGSSLTVIPKHSSLKQPPCVLQERMKYLFRNSSSSLETQKVNYFDNTTSLWIYDWILRCFNV